MNTIFTSSHSLNDTGTAPNDRSVMSTSAACVILGLSFLVGAPGNLLVIWTILKHIRQRSHTVLLILHLAVADLLVLITLPLWMYSLASSWVFGRDTCKAVVYVVNACMYSSVFLITIMSVERFVAICYPFKMLGQKSVGTLSKCLGGMWCVALLLGIPAILVNDVGETDDGTLQCTFKEFTSDSQELLCLSLESSVGFVIPFVILAVCYYKVASQLRSIQSPAKRRSAILIGCVVATFALLWLPHHIVNIADIVVLSTGSAKPDFRDNVVFVAGALAFISSSINPVLYAFAARNFQGGLRRSGFVKLFLDVASNSVKTKQTLEVQMATQTEV
ncbi:leukotriene B4 receptor 1-like [Engraulis encrasicolus]|uniref:leukotriene B4 receptor 1-like n=1 Tax=Engraulis encrasicolus TaxID=184585 RepID=UPI002FD49CD0